MGCERKKQEGWLWNFGFKQQAKSCHNEDGEDGVDEVCEKSGIQAGKLGDRLCAWALNVQFIWSQILSEAGSLALGKD